MLEPAENTDNSDVSIVEELDPEPVRPDAGRFRRRELVLGMALLLAVLAWGGWQWWHTDTQATSYHAAQQAAAKRDWDAARRLYAATPGYKDSDKRLDEANTIITGRDRDYNHALQAKKSGDWAVLMREVEEVREVQPGYKDTDSLYALGEANVYRAALDGAIVSRGATKGNPAGLYVRDGDSWRPLEGSDADSRVRGTGTAGYVIYDVPLTQGSNSETPKEISPTDLDSSFSFSPLAGVQNRRLVLASLKYGETQVSAVALQSGSYQHLIWGDHGVWGLRYSNHYAITRPTGLRGGMFGIDLDYQAFNSALTSTLVLPAAGWAIYDLSPDGEHVLLAQVDGSKGSLPEVSVYLADALGQNRKRLYTYSGSIESAEFGPDGRMVLLQASKPVSDSYNEEQSVILLDTKGDIPPHTLATMLHDSTSQVPGSNITARFLSGGTFSGDVLLARWGDTDGSIETYDPARPNTPLAHVQVESRPVGRMWVDEGPDAGGVPSVLVAWQNSLGTVLPFGDSMTVVTLREPGLSSVAKVPLGERELSTAAWLRDGRFVFDAFDFSTDANIKDYVLSSVPLSKLDTGATGATGAAKPGVVYSTSVIDSSTGNSNPFGAASNKHVGPGMLAYSVQGKLHVRAYDGSIDLSFNDPVTLFQSTERAANSDNLASFLLNP